LRSRSPACCAAVGGGGGGGGGGSRAVAAVVVVLVAPPATPATKSTRYVQHQPLKEHLEWQLKLYFVLAHLNQVQSENSSSPETSSSSSSSSPSSSSSSATAMSCCALSLPYDASKFGCGHEFCCLSMTVDGHAKCVRATCCRQLAFHRESEEIRGLFLQCPKRPM
jgi:hypothetical protein